MTFILHLILIITIINYFMLFFVFLQKLLKKSTNIFQYKITYIYITFFFSFCYIFIFFFLLYIWRISNVNIINLKTMYDNYHRFWLINISHLNLIYQIYLLFLFLLFIFIFLLCFIKLLQYFNTQVFKSYIFILYKYNYDKNYVYIKKLIILFEEIGNASLITYLFRQILINNIRGNITLSQYSKRLIDWLFFRNYTRIEFLITFSPLIFIIYDIYCNNFLLIYFTYYLFFYIPMMLLKRLTTFFTFNNNIMIILLHKMLYVKETKVIYAINPKFHAIFNNLLTTLSTKSLEEIDISFFLNNTIRFELENAERNVYMNSDGVYLKLTSDNKVFEEIEEEEILFDLTTDEGYKTYMESNEEFASKTHYKLGKEWILLLKK